MHTYRPTTADDIVHVARNMRHEDMHEVLASDGQSPLMALVESVAKCPECFTLVIGGRPLAIFGCAQYEPGLISVWMLSTKQVRDHRHLVTREARRILDGWNASFGTLFNYVSTEAVTTRAWLRALGFTEGDPVPWGINGEPFHRFTRHPHV